MKFHPEDYQKAVEYWSGRDFPHITPEQHGRILEKGRDLIKFHLRHPVIHHLISLFSFVIIFCADWWVLLRLGAYIKSPVLAGVVVGVVHGYIMYSLAVYTLHEGAAHKLIVMAKGRLSRFFAVLANNLNRITLAETDYYAKSHMAHHAHFATPQDDEFLNFVSSKRLFSSFIPFASVLNFSDFKAHTGMTFTPSRLLALFLTTLYHAVFAFFMLQHYSLLMIFVALALVFPNFAFWLDRLRQYMEHNAMPLHVVDGARDLGNGFWGMLIGGGPWGQPCHWTHHLVPGVPWYNQLRLHGFVKSILTPEQKKVFLLSPVTGFPTRLLEVIRITSV